MGYFNIIDSLNDVKVNEGMTEQSIPKNKNNDIDKLVKALQSCDIDFIPDKYIKCYKSFYNRSSFSKNFVDNVIKWTGMLKNKSNNGAKLYMLCLGDGSKVRDLLDTLNTPMNMFAHINNGSLIISLLLKSQIFISLFVI